MHVPRFRSRILLGMLLGLLPLALLQAAAPTPQATFPTMITVEMFDLNDSGNPVELCSVANENLKTYGCSFDTTREYPYRDAQGRVVNPITISIDDDYLLDVVPRELDPEQGFHPVAVHAQGIAARSYAYWKLRQGQTINNSALFQVFVPYVFDRLGLASDATLDPFPLDAQPCDPTRVRRLRAEQQIVCAAVTDRRYLAEANSTAPLHAEFFADVIGATTTVADPISTGCLVENNGHRRGMSQRGASRWAWGNRCASPLDGNDPWPVRWFRVEHLLTHYYPASMLRAVDDPSQVRVATSRWHLLDLRWLTPDGQPPLLRHDQPTPLRVQVQNSSPFAWLCDQAPEFRRYELRPSWQAGPQRETLGGGTLDLCGLGVGASTELRDLVLTDIPNWGPGTYTLRLDVWVRSISGSYRFAAGGWPPMTLRLCVERCQERQALVLQGGSSPAVSP